MAKNYQDRLRLLFESGASYHTFQPKIRERIVSLAQRRNVHTSDIILPAILNEELKEILTKASEEVRLFLCEFLTESDSRLGDPVSEVIKDDLKGVLPDKEHFWTELLKYKVSTHEKTASGEKNEKFAYWNPEKDLAKIEFDAWDCITTGSLAWIPDLSEQAKQLIIQHLKDTSVLNDNDQLINFDLTKAMDLPDSFTAYCKAIKDTLYERCIYRFILDHLSDCVIIDMEHDICSTTAAPSKGTVNRAPSFKAKTTCISIVDIIISMSTTSNPPSESSIEHIESGSTCASTVTSFSLKGFSVADHIPNETLNQKLFDELQKQNLRVTHVSDKGLNCMINAIIQHTKMAYDIPFFKESQDLHSELQSLYPSEDLLAGMLHCDDKYAKSLLFLINNYFSSNIGSVSVVIASSDGPIIYGGTCDDRFQSGRHVVIWQQGIHFVSIVHQEDLIQLDHHGEYVTTDSSELTVPKLTHR